MTFPDFSDVSERGHAGPLICKTRKNEDFALKRSDHSLQVRAILSSNAGTQEMAKGLARVPIIELVLYGPVRIL